jgi:two-component system chemotaxis sensor kinase CheA
MCDVVCTAHAQPGVQRLRCSARANAGAGMAARLQREAAMSDDMADVVREFLGESRENLDQIDVDLVALENSPDDKSIVARIFRTIHTIKGTCGFLGFTRLESVSHAGENVLSALRDEEIAPTSTMTTVLLAMVDVIRAMLAQIETTGEEGNGDYTALIE